MPDAPLYERDFYTWTQEQAARLRELDGHATLDVPNLVDEVADLGRSELNKTREHLVQTLRHLVLAATRTGVRAGAGGWMVGTGSGHNGSGDTSVRASLREARTHQRQARDAFSPGMRQNLDLAALWRDALGAANDDLEAFGEGPVDTDVACPLTLDQLVAERFDRDAALDAVADALGSDG